MVCPGCERCVAGKEARGKAGRPLDASGSRLVPGQTVGGQEGSGRPFGQGGSARTAMGRPLAARVERQSDRAHAGCHRAAQGRRRQGERVGGGHAHELAVVRARRRRPGRAQVPHGGSSFRAGPPLERARALDHQGRSRQAVGGPASALSAPGAVRAGDGAPTGQRVRTALASGRHGAPAVDRAVVFVQEWEANDHPAERRGDGRADRGARLPRTGA